MALVLCSAPGVWHCVVLIAWPCATPHLPLTHTYCDAPRQVTYISMVPSWAPNMLLPNFHQHCFLQLGHCHESRQSGWQPMASRLLQKQPNYGSYWFSSFMYLLPVRKVVPLWVMRMRETGSRTTTKRWGWVTEWHKHLKLENPSNMA